MLQLFEAALRLFSKDIDFDQVLLRSAVEVSITAIKLLNN